MLEGQPGREVVMGASGSSMMEALQAAVLPHAQAILDNAFNGRVTIVVSDPGALARKVAQEAGWDGKRACFPMPEEFRRTLAIESDAITAAWLERGGQIARVLVMMGTERFLLNFTESLGWHLEPDSTGPEGG
jgi:hypothetical protein